MQPIKDLKNFNNNIETLSAKQQNDMIFYHALQEKEVHETVEATESTNSSGSVIADDDKEKVTTLIHIIIFL